MITYTITGDSILVSTEDRTYIEKRFSGLERFMDESIPHEIAVTVSKNTAHERENSVKVEISFKLHEREFFAEGIAPDVRAATDMAKEEIMREVTHSNARRRTLFHRGARKLKNLIKRGFRA